MSMCCLKSFLSLVIFMTLRMLIGILNINLCKHLSITKAVKHSINQIEKNVNF